MQVNRDTQLCISVSARPSEHGNRFHNYLYEKLGLNFIYKAHRVEDIDGAIAGVRALGIRGCSVSMPHKQRVLDLVDEVDESAAVIGAVNTVVNTDGHLAAYNTDVLAVSQLLAQRAVDPSLPVLLRGSGGMAAAVAGAFYRAGFSAVTIVARNEQAGRALASRYGWDWVAHEDQLSVSLLATARPAVLVNVTPLGMEGGDESETLSFPLSLIDSAQVIVDAVALPVATPLVRAARERSKQIIHGGDIIALQAAEQFKLYTGVELTPELVREAEEYASIH